MTKRTSATNLPAKELSKYDAWQQLKMFQRSLSIDSLNSVIKKEKERRRREEEEEEKEDGS